MSLPWTYLYERADNAQLTPAPIFAERSGIVISATHGPANVLTSYPYRCYISPYERESQMCTVAPSNRKNHLRLLILMWLIILVGCQGLPRQTSLVPAIRLEPVPDHGIQPLLATDARGVVHLIYFKKSAPDGTERSGHLYYRSYEQGRWSPALRVSSSPFDHQDAIARASLAMDSNGRVHVGWLSSDLPALMYSRSDIDRQGFATERAIVREPMQGVESSASIAAGEDTVSIVWHAGDQDEEEERRVYAISSQDAGAGFGAVRTLDAARLGACGCCDLAASYGNNGHLLVAYRSAINGDGRHMQLLDTGPEGEFHGGTRLLSEWFIAGCPVTTSDFTHRTGINPGKSYLWLVFETRGRIYTFDAGNPGHSTPAPVRESLVPTRQKHPAIAVNDAGYRLIVWGEAPGYVAGGTLNLQLVDKTNRIQPAPDTRNLNIADHSAAAVATLKDGSFLVLY